MTTTTASKTPAPETWLVAHDFSDCGDLAVREAARVVEKIGGRLVLLHVHPAPQLRPEEAWGEETYNLEEGLRVKLQGLAVGLKEKHPRLDIDVDVVQAKEPARGILEEARRLDVDHVVVGTHGRKGLNHRGMTSVVVLYDARFAAVIDKRVYDGPRPLTSSSPAVQDAIDAPHVARALEARGHSARTVALGDDPISQLRAVVDEEPDLVFNLCDSLLGRSRHAALVPAFLELHGVAFAGAGSAGVVVGRRKHDVKALLVREGIPTPRFQVIADERALPAFSLHLEPPVIGKLTAEHASIGLDAGAVCWTTDEVIARARKLLPLFEQPLLVEEFVQGRELFVSCLGEPLAPLRTMEHTFENIPDGFLRMRTFETKWASDPTRAGDAPVLDVDPRWAAKVPPRSPAVPFRGGLGVVEPLAARALAAVGARDWGRVDMRVDDDGVPLVIDVTPNSYLHPKSPCVKAANAAGLSYDDFVDAIARAAIARGGRTER
jgi:D-alanine-D-alanine ligase